jgi:hypothetical protein
MTAIECITPAFKPCARLAKCAPMQGSSFGNYFKLAAWFLEAQRHLHHDVSCCVSDLALERGAGIAAPGLDLYQQHMTHWMSCSLPHF